MIVHLTLASSNRKTGPIPVSVTERASCPTVCAFYDKGCYAAYGPLGMHWRKVKAKGKDKRGFAWSDFLRQIKALPKNQLWRHNSAGDLPGEGNRINSRMLKDLVSANVGKFGFTYTHKPLTQANSAAIADANLRGFVINLSADNLAQADEKYNSGIGPVVVVLPIDAQTGKRYTTPQGRKVVTCPATVGNSTLTCAQCGLCAVGTRKSIVGFPAHGNTAKTVNQRVTEIRS